LYRFSFVFPSLESIGFKESKLIVKDYLIPNAAEYAESRNFPAVDATSNLSVHLRFGTVCIRKIISRIIPDNAVFLNELIWREFFMQILFHFPHVEQSSFNPKSALENAGTIKIL
jgi:deoxyribodipyrimidine photo-lyase